MLSHAGMRPGQDLCLRRYVARVLAALGANERT
jgi:hypothetical protein